MDSITNNWKILMEDGAVSASYYFHKAVSTIDSQFGQGYAKDHPELIGSFMSAASADCAAATIAKSIQDHALQLSESGNPLINVLSEIRKSIDDITWTEVSH